MSDLIARVISNAQQRGPAAAPVAGTPSGLSQRIVSGVNASIEGAELQARRSAWPTSLVLQQQVSTGEGGEISNSSVAAVFNLADRAFYLDLQVLERLADNTKPTEEPGERLLGAGGVLRPGIAYVVRASLSLNEYQPSRSSVTWLLSQKQVRIERQLALFLEAGTEIGLSARAAGVSGQDGRLQLETWHGWHHDFDVEVPSGQPSGMGTFRLLYREVESSNLERTATTLTVPLEGDAECLPARIVRYLPVATEPPPNTAILHVRPADHGRLQAIGWVRDRMNRPLSLEPIDQPSALAEDYEDEGAYLDAVSQELLDYGIGNPANLIGWLGEVVDRYGASTCLVVIDQAGSRIPWEMLKLSGGRYLGASAVVVRWTETQYRDRPITLQLSEALYCGRLAALVDRLNAPFQIRLALRKLTHQRWVSWAELQNDLLTADSPVGLVYLDSDGLLVYGDEGDALDALKRTSHRTAAVTVRFDELDDVGGLEPRPIFFANAPHSGRILWRTDGQACGLTRAALIQVAAGYIGTIGPIEPTFAAAVAERLLDAASTPEGVQPAELLRDLRVELAIQLAQRTLTWEQRTVARRHFRYICMYVYYGNPRARLRLEVPEAEPGIETEDQNG